MDKKTVKKKIIINLDIPESLMLSTEKWEELEDRIRDLFREEFYGDVMGEIKSEITGNTIKIDVPVCPHCSKPVLYLENEQDLLCVWKFYPDGNYSPVPEFERMEHLGDINHWVCPHCGKVIAETEEDALKFLNGD